MHSFDDNTPKAQPNVPFYASKRSTICGGCADSVSTQMNWPNHKKLGDLVQVQLNPVWVDNF